MEILENLGSLEIPLGLGVRKNVEMLGTLGVPLGLGILGNARENLKSVGTLAVLLDLENLKKTRSVMIVHDGHLGKRLG